MSESPDTIKTMKAGVMPSIPDVSDNDPDDQLTKVLVAKVLPETPNEVYKQIIELLAPYYKSIAKQKTLKAILIAIVTGVFMVAYTYILLTH